MTPTEILIAAREKIERGWAQGEYARAKNGNPIGYNAEKAVCWCSIGAIIAVDDDDPTDRAVYTLSDIVGRDITEWNDAPGRTQAEVLAAFDKAIEASKRTPEGKGQP